MDGNLFKKILRSHSLYAFYSIKSTLNNNFFVARKKTPQNSNLIKLRVDSNYYIKIKIYVQ